MTHSKHDVMAITTRQARQYDAGCTASSAPPRGFKASKSSSSDRPDARS